MTNAQITKALKSIQEEVNDLTRRMEAMLLEKHEENSEAIDDIIIAMLEGDEDEE